VTEQDTILKKTSRPIERFDHRLFQLLDDMKETMVQANGIGLAAPQVGVLRRVVVIDTGEEITEFINPVIEKQSKSTNEEMESCLSCPGYYGLVKRPKTVTVRAQNRDGQWFSLTGEKRIARAMCHEIDHINGVLYKERAKELYTEDEIEEK